MTTNHHTPHAFGAALTSAEVNRPLGELDAAIARVIATGSGVSTTLTAQATAGSSGPFSVASTASLLPGDVVFFGDAGGTHESRVVNTVPSGTTFTTTANLTNTYAIGKTVSKSPVELADARGSYSSLGGRLAAIEARVFDVRRYGAVGNGVADDLAAFQAAATAVAAAGGGIIWVPAGTYKLGNSWNIDVDFVHVELARGAAVFTDGATSSGHTIGFIGNVGLGTATTPQRSWASIRGGRVYNLNNGTADNAVAFVRYKNARCEGVWISAAGRKAITAQYGVDNVYFADNIIDTTGDAGITVESTCMNVHVRGNRITSAGAIGISLTTSITEARVTDNVIEDSGGTGIAISATRAWVERNTIRSAGTAGIFSASGTELVVRGNEIYQPSQHGMDIRATIGRCEVAENYISGAGQAGANTYDAIIFTSVACRPIVTGNRSDGALHRYNVNAVSMSTAQGVYLANVWSAGATGTYGGWAPLVGLDLVGATPTKTGTW